MAQAIALIAGLGNPGPKYAETRHNAGFLFVDELARQSGTRFRASKFSGELAELPHAGGKVLLLKPDTFMNRSGQSVGALARFYKIAPEQVLVAHDELDMPPGTVKLKKGGGHGGHNGLRDIAQHLGSKDFVRLRIGIGHPGDAKLVSNYVLNPASRDDQILIDRALDEALDVLPMVLEGDIEKAMLKLHTS